MNAPVAIPDATPQTALAEAPKPEYKIVYSTEKRPEAIRVTVEYSEPIVTPRPVFVNLQQSASPSDAPIQRQPDEEGRSPFDVAWRVQRVLRLVDRHIATCPNTIVKEAFLRELAGALGKK